VEGDDVDPWEDSGEDLIDEQGRNPTQQRIDGEIRDEDGSDEVVHFEPDDNWLEGGDPEATPS
jgi:hypothetical protein